MIENYISPYSVENVQEKLKDMIKVEAPDSFKTHLSQIFLFRKYNEVCGFFKGRYFEMWWSKGLTGVFNPILSVIASTNGRTEILVYSKMNKVGATITALIMGAVSLAFENILDIKDAPSFWQAIKIIYESTFITIPFLTVPLIFYTIAKNTFIGKIKERLSLNKLW